MSDSGFERLAKVVESISDNDIRHKEQTLNNLRRKLRLFEELAARLPPKEREQVLCAFFYEMSSLVGDFKCVIASRLTREDKRAAKRSGDPQAIFEALRKSAAFAFDDEHKWD